jgi:hypothetical protein
MRYDHWVVLFRSPFNTPEASIWPMTQQMLAYVVRYPRNAVGQTSLAYAIADKRQLDLIEDSKNLTQCLKDAPRDATEALTNLKNNNVRGEKRYEDEQGHERQGEHHDFFIPEYIA